MQKLTLFQKIILTIAEHFGIANFIREKQNEMLAEHYTFASNAKGLNKDVRATLKFVAERLHNSDWLPFYIESYSFDNEIQNNVDKIKATMSEDNRNKLYE